MAQPRPEGCRPLGERDPHQSRWAYATTIYTEQSIRFIEQSVQAGRPFYINVMLRALAMQPARSALTGARQRRTSSPTPTIHRRATTIE